MNRHRVEAPQIDDLRVEDTEACWELWRQGFLGEAARCAWIPRAWAEDSAGFSDALASRVEAGRAVAARVGGRFAGFVAYDAFRFHGEDCAFSPVTAHAAVGTPESERLEVYEAMYRNLSHRWVGNGRLTHLLTLWAHDTALRDLAVDLGFGLYVVDAYRATEPLDAPIPPGLEIRKAGAGDEHDLERLVEESRVYYAQAPLFLIREPLDLQGVRKLLEDEGGAVFLASRAGLPVGFMNVRLSEGDDLLMLCRRGTAMLDPLGAYVRASWRTSGVGKALLGRCVAWARQRGAAQVHVDFESANLPGSRFWRRHFTDALASVKRTVFRDALEGRRIVTVVDHDPAWARRYEEEALALRGAFGRCMVAVHHIGSTSIPGMPAKPILDILVEVDTLEAVDRLSGSLEALGYRAMGEHGIPGRRYFQKGHPQHTHHVRVYGRGDPNLLRHLAFRDYLRTHPDRAREYAALKRSLVARDPYDVEGYQRGKSGLAAELEREAIAWLEG